MAFQISPGVQVIEKDFTSVIPAVSTSIGAYAGLFNWGPVDEIIQVSTEKDIVSYFGTPSQSNVQSFLQAASFLKYGSALKITRAIASGADHSAPGTFAVNAVAVGATGVLVKNKNDFDGMTGLSSYEMIAAYPGAFGNSIKVEICSGSTAFAAWAYKGLFNSAPSSSISGAAAMAGTTIVANDEVHVVVIDEDGLLSGTIGTVLEVFPNLSLASDAKKEDGTNIFYQEYINKNSEYVYIVGHNAGLDNAGLTLAAAKVLAVALTTPTSGTKLAFAYDTGAGPTYTQATTAVSRSLISGLDGEALTGGDIADALTNFADSDIVDINLLFAWQTTSDVIKEVVDAKIYEITAARKDIVGFISAPLSIASLSSEAAKVTAVTSHFNGATYGSSSYIVLDSTPLYVYNRFHDTYVWIPASGHMAGLCANTDEVADAWWSPAGFNRGQLLGVTKLALNPSKANRDELYKGRINMICSFPGEGTILYGDKTAQTKPSAFDRINVRRLFLVLEKAIAKASKYQLFEFNDEFTRANFVNMVEPFLRDIKGRRGITDFAVVCDETNNNPQVIDTNNFAGDIYVSPARSINFINLSFIATRTGVNFSEIIGKNS